MRISRLQVSYSVVLASLFTALAVHPANQRSEQRLEHRTLLPTGKEITPLATPGARFQSLDPELPDFPRYTAGQAISTGVSPNGKTLLVLTSGFNRLHGGNGKVIDDASEEYVFVYDISLPVARKIRVLKVPNSFAGLTFAGDGRRFFVSGGVDDNVHTFVADPTGRWTEKGKPIPLGHSSGLGLTPGKEPLAAGGLAVTDDGKYLLVANVYNDSVSCVDLKSRKVIGELDLRPGKNDARQAGVAGGEYPFWIVAKGNNAAYVSCLRDREIVEIGLRPRLHVLTRIKVSGNPNKMTLNRSRSRLFAAADNSDAVIVVDTHTNKVLENISTGLPGTGLARWTGNGPNDVALSHDERTLFVSNGGTNSVALIRLDSHAASRVIGLLPTGWYPNAVSVSADDRTLYVVNGKSAPGPNPRLHLKVKNADGITPGPDVTGESQNQYILQLEKAGFLTLPLPNEDELSRLTSIVAENNGFISKPNSHDVETMKALHSRIRHVIYIIKENRTYDQILGDLGRGNGDPRLTEFGEAITPNFHRVARSFVDLDNFFNSGEVSGDGWPWSTSGRESDFGQKGVPLNYANRGTNYEYEGLNRDINVGLPNVKQRRAANPKTPADPDLLPGAVNVAEPDGPRGTPQGKGYIWDAVLRAGLTFREYGCMSDTNLDAPRDPEPFKNRTIMSRPSNPELYKFGDPYYRGFDPGYPDFYREAEWEREFDAYAAHSDLPSFEIVQLPVDHMGDFDTAISKVNTPEAQQADNDYATARLIERVAHSRYAKDTLIFVIEDDSQDGPDHVDAHRTTAYVVGPYVKHGAVVSHYYTTVSMVRTMEDVLGLDHLNLNTATSAPMTDVFDLTQAAWTFEAAPSSILSRTDLPLTGAARKAARTAAPVRPAHDSHYWAQKTKGFDFSGEDRVDADLFNRIVWEGLMRSRYPAALHPGDLVQ